MKKALAYIKKYPSILMVLAVVIGTTVGGTLLNNTIRSKEVGVLGECGRTSQANSPELQDCVAKKTVRGFPVKTTVNYKITHKPTDQPAVNDTLRVRYSETKNPLYDAANYLIGGLVTIVAGAIALQAYEIIKKRRTQKNI